MKRGGVAINSHSANTMVSGSVRAGNSLLCGIGDAGCRENASEDPDGAVCEAGEHIGQVLKERHAQLAAALNNREDGRDFAPGLRFGY
jgi:hypothetical protein